jgi:hypothetical protein
MKAMAAAVGLVGRAAVASIPIVAEAALRAGRGSDPFLVARGGERAFLESLPLEALCGDSRMVAALRRVGVRATADLAALPASGVGATIGARGAALVELMRGEQPAGGQGRRARRTERAGLGERFFGRGAGVSPDALAEAVQRMAVRLAARLLGRDELAVALEIVVSGRPAAVILGQPTGNAAELATMISRQAIPAGARGVDLQVRVTRACPAHERPAEPGSTLPLALSPATTQASTPATQAATQAA